MKMDNKVQCIKELMHRTKIGLLDAKAVIDKVEQEFGCLEIDIAELFVDYAGCNNIPYYRLDTLRDTFDKFVKEYNNE